MPSIRMEPEMDRIVRRAAAQRGETLSEFLRTAAVERARNTLDNREQVDALLTDVIGSVQSDGESVARRTGDAFSDLLAESGDRKAPRKP